MSCQTMFPKICGYYLSALIITLGVSTTLWSLPQPRIVHMLQINLKNRFQWSHRKDVGLRPIACWDCGFESAGGMVVCLLNLLYVVRSGWSLVHRSTAECGVSECDLETSIMRKSRPTRAVKP